MLCNMTIPDYSFKKKSQSIAYNIICEGASKYEWTTAPKCLPPGEKRKGYIFNIMHHIFGLGATGK